MLDPDLVKYIMVYYSHFMKENEAAAFKHAMATKKIEFSENSEKMKELIERKYEVPDNKEVLDLLKDGSDQFYVNTATRILEENKDSIFLNNCPQCGRLARTPLAKQCRFCGYGWHNE